MIRKLDPIQVGKTLRELRTEKGYSQDYISYKLCKSQNAYSKCGLGKTRMTVEAAFKLADIFELDAEDFLAALLKHSQAENENG